MMKHILSASIATILAFPAAAQTTPQTLYWDINGANPGASDNGLVIGAWGGNFWSTDASGATPTGAYVQDSYVVFSAGTNGSGSEVSRIDVDGVFTVRGLTFEEGTVQIGNPVTGPSSLFLGAGGITMKEGLNGNVTFSTSITEGVLLTASQTWANNTTSRTLQLNTKFYADEGKSITLTIDGSGATGVGVGGGAVYGGFFDGAGTLSLVKNGTGTMSLYSPGDYSGTTTIKGGTLVLHHGAGLGSTSSGTVVENGGTLALSSAVITEAGESVTIYGAGNASFGSLSTNPNGAGGTWSGDVILGTGARLGARANTTTVTTLTVAGGIKGTAQNQDLVISGELGLGTVLLSAPSGQSTYTGETRLVRGVLKLGADNTIPATSVLDMHVVGGNDPTTFDLNGFNQTLAGLQRTLTNTASTVTNSAAGPAKTLTLDQNLDTVFGGTGASAGVITGNLTLVKGGVGTLILTAKNSYSGGTVLTGGRLEGDVDGVFGTGNVTVTETATSLTIATGVLDAIADSATLSLAGGGVFGIADQGYLSLGMNVQETVYSLVLGGVVMPAGIYGSSDAIGVPAANQLNEYFRGSGSLIVTVPEPTSGLLMFAGLSSLLGARRLRRGRR